jgi:hypothetical protein
MKHFQDHLKNITDPKLIKTYYPNVTRPKISKNVYYGSKNTYNNYDEWIFRRIKLKKENIIDDNTYFSELNFYRHVKAAEWIQEHSNSSVFKKSDYPETITLFNDEIVNMWFSKKMFHEVKNKFDFSIFEDTNVHGVLPTIPGFFILCYTTNCDEPKYGYSREEIEFVMENMNHGGFSDRHFYLLFTSLLGAEFRNGSHDLFCNLKYALKYGEFKEGANQFFLRFGKETGNRAYNSTQDYNAPIC